MRSRPRPDVVKFWTLMLVLAPGCVAAAGFNRAVEGHWEGTCASSGRELRVAFDLSSARCTYDVPELGVYSAPLGPHSFGDRSFSIEIPAKKPLRLSGRVEKDRLVGSAQAATTMPFTVTRVTARPRLQREVPVTYASGDVTLSGTLILPDGPGPFPAVVLIHGSAPEGKMTRERLRNRANLFVRSGVAALIYDRRGNGASGGSSDRILPMDVLAKDAAAGAVYLASRSDLAPRRIGFYGISQGGWVAPYAASLFSGTGFVMTVSAPGVTPDEQDVFATGKIVEKYVRGAMGSAGADADREVERVTADNASLVAHDGPEIVPGFSRFDPLPYWERLKVPVLAVYGDQDKVVPVEQSRNAIERALKRGGNEHRTIRVFPGADHELRLESTDPNGFRPMADGCEEAMSHWLRDNVAAGDPAPARRE